MEIAYLNTAAQGVTGCWEMSLSNRTINGKNKGIWEIVEG
jgi:hypothetical protein